MGSKAIDRDHSAAEEQIYPDLSSFVSDNAEFRLAVQAGVTSFDAGPTYDAVTVEAELRDIIQNPE